MAVEDYFLKLDGIDGESQDSKHSKEVEVLSFRFKAVQTGSAGSGTGGLGKGKVKVEDLVIWKKLDKSTPKLFLHCCNGEPIKKVVLTARKAGKDQQDHYKITLTDCLVSLFESAGGDHEHEGGSAGKDDWTQTEKVSFNYSTIDVSYKAQKPDGTLEGELKGGWSCIQNKQL
ncbi:MAG: type VI secretion system tube protein Hcp [Bryobacteraceae bacterium]|jgi:type VI secretion system secreted protein Hcp